GFTDTLYHNTFLIDDRNISGYAPVSVYPPDQGWWGRDAQLTKHADAGDYAYAQADFGDAYVNNDGVRNSGPRGPRSIGFPRPGTFVVFDPVQTANAAVRKIFNVNFAGTLSGPAGGVWSTTVGNSTLFMQPLLDNGATTAVNPLAGPNALVS